MLLHLQRCPPCQDRVSELSTTATRLLELVPEAQPPPGFEQRVLTAIQAAASPASGTVADRAPHRHRVSAAVFIAACALLLVGGLLTGLASPLVHPDRPSAAPSIAQAADVMVAPLIADDDDTAIPPSTGSVGAPSGNKTGRDIGQAWIHLTRPSWVYVSITDPDLDTAEDPTPGAGVTTAESVTCTLVQRDGVLIPLGSFSLLNGRADWAAPTPIDSQPLAQSQLTIAHGRTLARASFADPTTSQAGSSHTNTTPNKKQNHDQSKGQSKDKDQSKDQNKDKDKDKGKDQSPGQDNDKKNNQDKGQSSQNNDKKHQAGADLKDKIPAIALSGGKHNDKNQLESRPPATKQHHKTNMATPPPRPTTR